MNSGTVLAGNAGFTSITPGPWTRRATGTMSRMKSKPRLALIAFASFDHLIGAREQRWGHLKAEHSGGCEVEHQVEPGWLLDWQVPRLGAVQDLVDILGGTPEQFLIILLRTTLVHLLRRTLDCCQPKPCIPIPSGNE